MAESTSIPAAKRPRCEKQLAQEDQKELLLGSAELTAFSTLRLPSSELFPAEGGGFSRLLTPNRKLELRWHANAKPVVARGRGKKAQRTPQDTAQARLAGSSIYFSAYGKEVGRFPADAARCLVPMLLQDCIAIEAFVGSNPPAELETGISIPVVIRIKSKAALWAADKTDISCASAAMLEKAEWSRILRSYSLPFLLKLIGLKPKLKADAGATLEEPLETHDLEELEAECCEDKTEMREEVAAQLGSCEALEHQELPRFCMPKHVFRTTLRNYQAQGVLWMWQRENPGLTLPSHFLDGASPAPPEEPAYHHLDPMWEEYELNDPTNLPLYFNRVTGALSYHFPESGLVPCRGGILADDMGLGKTVTCLALIALDKVKELRELVCDTGSVQGSTLVVLPVSILHQWQSEISQHCLSKPSVLVYHGANCKAQNLKDYDIVLTTYGVVCNASHSKAISDIQWRRVILDEGHIVKNRLSRRAVAVFQLRAARRWVVTGTPMQNNIDEVYSLIRFLGVNPWSMWSAWHHAVSDPFRRGDVPGALNEAHRIVQPLVLRRTKQTLDPKTGQPLVTLPSKFVHILEIDLSPVERALYDALYRTMKAKFENLLKSDKVLKHYFYVLQMLMMLRQATCHPFLAFARSRPRDASLEAFAERCFGGTTSSAPAEGGMSTSDSKLITGLLNDARDDERSLCSACGEMVEEKFQAKPCGHILCHACGGSTEHYGGECRACLNMISHESSDGSLPEELYSSKVRVLMKVLRADMEAGRCVVVFSQWTAFLQLIGRALDGQLPALMWKQFDGSLSTSQRRSVVEWFQQETKQGELFQQEAKQGGRVLLISLMAGGVGLNLTAASRLYMCDLWWNPAMEEQAIQRIHRIGQKQEVHIYKFVIKDSIDQGIVALQRAKSLLCEGLLQHKAALRGHYTNLGIEDFKLLFSHGADSGRMGGC
jgi:DNA repair protein RAD5